MQPLFHVGNCGYSYFSPSDYFGEGWKSEFKSILQAYAKKFDCVEINSSFYRVPKVETAEKWLEQAREVNKEFVFTVKAFQGITHAHRFGGEKAVQNDFALMKEVCEALRADLLVLQSPAGFAPSERNLQRMREFFSRIERGRLQLAWEPRGEWWAQEGAAVEQTCREFGLINCVDPLRNPPKHFEKKTAYFRLHGFGWPTMYSYSFSAAELLKVKATCENLFGEGKARDFFVFFNNADCYDNALEFRKLVE